MMYLIHVRVKDNSCTRFSHLDAEATSLQSSPSSPVQMENFAKWQVIRKFGYFLPEHV